MATTALTRDVVATETAVSCSARPEGTALMAGAPHYCMAIVIVLVLALAASTVIGGGTAAVAAVLGGAVGGALFTLARDSWHP